jgi:hypothetical protein
MFQSILGQYMHVFLNRSFPLQVPFEYVASLPLDQWKEEWFDACNPRAMLPIKDVLHLLQGTKCIKAVKQWTQYMNDIHNPHLDDVSRERLSKQVLHEILDSGYVFLPCLAWLIDRLEWDQCLALCEEVFGRGEVDAKVSEKYREIESAIMKENLFRHYSDLQDLFSSIFSHESSRSEASRSESHREATMRHVVRLTHMYLSRSVKPLPDMDVVRKIMKLGFLAHVVKLPRTQHSYAQELMRNMVRNRPGCQPWMTLVSCW